MKNLAIFASGSGTNAENIAKTFASGNRIRVSVVLTDRENAGVVERMKALDIPVIYFPGKVWKEEPTTIVEALKPYDIDLVVLAGFMRKVADPLIEAYPDRMLNIHPSLLPAYGGKGMYGHHVHEAVIAAGEKQSGVTVHKVNSELDKGDIVMQGILDLEPDETPESLEAKIHEIEYELYPRAIVKTLRDLEATETANDNNNPPPIQEEVPTPDQLWSQALHIPYTPAPEEKKESENHQENGTTTPPPLAPPPVYNVPPTPDRLTTTPPSPVSESMTDIAEESKPAQSYLALSIIFILVFGIIPAIIPLIYSCKTRRLNSIGDYIGAHKASKVTQGWLIATFCIGVLACTIFFPLMFASLAF